MADEYKNSSCYTDRVNTLLAWLSAQGIPVSWDGLFLSFVCLLGTGVGLAVGRDRMALMSLTSYVAYAVVTSTPLLGIVAQYAGADGSPALRIGWFGGFFALVMVLLLRSPVAQAFMPSKGPLFERALNGLLCAGLLVVMAIVLLPPAYTAGIGPLTKNIFADPIGRSFWFLMPIVGFVLFGRDAGMTIDLDDSGEG